MTDNENVQEVDSVEVLKSESAISLVVKAEIDVQISTAKAYPRSIKKFLDKAMSIATVSEDIAQACAYALPRAGKTLEGPSVRLAEIVVGAYGNIRAGMRVIHNDGVTITAQGICHDLESNTCVTLEVKRSILQNEYREDPISKKKVKTGRRVTMSEDMQVVTGNAACAIAFRNSVFKIIPSALINDIYDKVKEVARGSVETLPARRDKALAYVRGLGVKDEQICSALELRAVEDIDLDKLAVLRGMCTLIKNGEATVNEVFPKPEPKAKSDIATDATTEAIKKATEKAQGKGKKDDKPAGDMPA
jgi:hypothetical protein